MNLQGREMDKLQNTHYDAFISYRHSPLDSFVAESLHKKLESFRLPKSVLKKVKNGKTRIERVFRDVDELPLSDDLSDPISNALANSDFLITICTPRYPLSRWCLKEIEVFLQTHPRDHILVVLADAEPADSFPEILTYEMVELKDENGIPHLVRKEIEPLAADTRGGNRKEILKAMDIAVIKLAAAMFGLNYDDLRQRHRERAMRRMISIFSVILAAVLIFAAVVTGMLMKISRQNSIITSQIDVISSQYAELQDKYAYEVAQSSMKLLNAGRKADAARALRGVLPDDGSEGYNAAALRSLYKTMDLFNVDGSYAPTYAYETDSEVYSFAVTDSKRYILINDLLSLKLYDATTGKLIREFVEEGSAQDGYLEGVFCGNEGIVYLSDTSVMYYSIADDEETEIRGYNEGCTLFSFPGSDTVIVYTDGEFIGVRDGKSVYKFSVTGMFPRASGDFFVTEMVSDRDQFACSITDLEESYMFIGELSTGNVFGLFSMGSDLNVQLAIYNNMLFYTSQDDSGREQGYAGRRLLAMRMNDTKYAWTADAGDTYIEDMWATEEYLYIYESFGIRVLDIRTGRDVAFHQSETDMIKGFVKDDALICLGLDGKVYRCDGGDLYEITDQLFKEMPDQRIADILMFDNRFFCLFERASYVTRYASEEIPEFDEYEDDIDVIYLWGEDATEELMEDEDFDSLLLDYGWYSEDEEYIVAYFSNHVLKILDADTYESIKEYSDFDDYIFSMRKSDVTGTYILTSMEHSYILDENYDIICEMGPVAGEEDDDLIVTTPWGKSYLVPWVDYGELMDITDKYLKSV